MNLFFLIVVVADIIIEVLMAKKVDAEYWGTRVKISAELTKITAIENKIENKFICVKRQIWESVKFHTVRNIEWTNHSKIC